MVCYDSFKHTLWITSAPNVKCIIYNRTLSYILFIISPFFVTTKTKNLTLQMSKIFHTMNSNFEACCLIMLPGVTNITVSFIDEWTGMENWWNADKDKLEYLEEKMSQCHFIHHKLHNDWSGFEPRSPWHEISSILMTSKIVPVHPNIKVHGKLNL